MRKASKKKNNETVKIVDDPEYHVEHMYKTLQKLEGLGERAVTDASTTINELLYGEHGAWKGQGE